MKIYIVRATARHKEVSGSKNFVHKRAFANRADADAFAPQFAAEIEADELGLLTYCDVKASVYELELVGQPDAPSPADTTPGESCDDDADHRKDSTSNGEEHTRFGERHAQPYAATRRDRIPGHN